MTETSDRDEELTRRLLRWLAIGGLVLGLTALPAVAGGLWQVYKGRAPLGRAIGPGFAVAWHAHVALICAATCLLIVGSAGLLRIKRWARPVLLSYVAVRFAAILFAAAQTLLLLSFRRGQPGWSTTEMILQLCDLPGSMIAQSVVPTIVLACMMWLKQPAWANSPHGGFEPILPN